MQCQRGEWETSLLFSVFCRVFVRAKKGAAKGLETSGSTLWLINDEKIQGHMETFTPSPLHIVSNKNLFLHLSQLSCELRGWNSRACDWLHHKFTIFAVRKAPGCQAACVWNAHRARSTHTHTHLMKKIRTLFLWTEASLNFLNPVTLLLVSIKKIIGRQADANQRNLPKARAKFQGTASIGSVWIGRKWAFVLDYFLVKTRFGPLSTRLYAKNAADMTRR